jgi:hypothetical protein
MQPTATPRVKERPRTSRPFNLPRVSSSDLLQALGLERRRSNGGKLAVGLGLVTAGALLGVGVLLLRAVLTGHEGRDASDDATELQPEAGW